MKFGKALAALDAAWRPHALAYKQLKLLLKQCAGLAHHQKLHAASFSRSRNGPSTDSALQASQAETAFFTALRNEIRKVNAFFLHQQQACGKRVQLLDDEIRATRRRVASGNVVGATEGRLQQWLHRAGVLYRELHTLESFCVLNFCGVSKMLKKHDKWTGFNTRTRFEHAVLVKQPFATYVPLLQMIHRVETIAVAVSVASITGRFVSAASSMSVPCISNGARPSATNGLKLPPLRIAVGYDADDADATDHEDTTPRDERDTWSNTDRDYYHYSEDEEQPPRQRRRLD